MPLRQKLKQIIQQEMIQLDTHIDNTSTLRDTQLTLNCLSGGGDVPENQSVFSQLEKSDGEITLSDNCRNRLNEKYPNFVESQNLLNASLVLSTATSVQARPSWAVTVFERNNRENTPIISVQAEPAQAEPAQAEPAQAEPAQAEPAQAEPAQAEPAQAGCTGTTIGGSFAEGLDDANREKGAGFRDSI